MEEANRRRIEEQKKKMMDMQQAREEQKKKLEEMKQERAEQLKKKQEEQRAMMAIRAVLLKLKCGKPEDADTLKPEAAEIMAKEHENCGPYKEAITKEHELSVKSIETRLKVIEEAKRKKEEEERLEAEKTAQFSRS